MKRLILSVILLCIFTLFANAYTITADPEVEKYRSKVEDELGSLITEVINAREIAYDLFLNDYGPNRLQGSVHVEVDDCLTAREIDDLSNQITLEVYKEHRVILTAVGIYSRNTNDSAAMEAKEKVIELLEGHKDVLQMHGFYFDKEKKIIKFDAVISFDSKDREAECASIFQEVLAEFPGYSVKINLDTDMSD